MIDGIPTFEDVVAAVSRLRGVVVQTPTLEDKELSRRLSGRVFLKCENLQTTGSFKFRGAFNRMAQLDPAERRRGVVAWSAGNHAQGVAAAGKMLGIDCTIVMPADAPQIKVERTRAFGADIRFYNRADANREEIGLELASKAGATIIPPFDDPDVIAGQATATLELIAAVQQLAQSSAP